MSLWSVQGERHRLRKQAGAALCALLTAAIFGCGRTGPEGIWEPTKNDTDGIRAAVEANKGYFRTGLAELAMTLCDTALPGTTRTLLYGDLRGNRFKGRFRLDSLQHKIDTNSYDLEYTFIAGLDTLSQETTCTVTTAETIPGKLRMHAWEKTDSLRESLFFPSPGETTRLPFYSDTFTPCNIVIEKDIAGASINGGVLKKVNGTWQLWKVAGGGRFYAPTPQDAPATETLRLVSGRQATANRTDTVALRPDTLHYGIHGLFSVDSADNQLLTFSRGDWVKASNLTPRSADAFDYLYFNGQRYELKDTVRFDSAKVSPGIYRLSFEHIPAPVLWEVPGKYSATVWGIPIRVQ